MQKEPRVFSSQKFLQHIFSFTSTALYIDRLQNRHYVFQQEFGVVCSAVGG
jgi:hypothetical protein